MRSRLHGASWVCALGLLSCGAPVAELPCDAAHLHIVEIMVDPVGPSAGDAAWLEIHNASAGEAPLEGVTLAVLTGKRRREVTLDSAHKLPPGGRWVLGERAAGPPVDQAYGEGLRLSKKRATLRLECGERLLDTMTYGADGVPPPGRGVSLQRSGDCWCLSQGLPYDGLNLGTPGRPKPACPAHACHRVPVTP